MRSPTARNALLAPRWTLTPRETEVLEHVTMGLSNRAIAAKLCCGERTVESHVTRLLWKSGCESRSQLVAQFWAEPL
ncbi:MAG: LuxR C-terminal-related transcriptional regulator [Archangium sp.]|nr:LuxR C-terminal-related transcriptional regulator [Archangium sp.]